MIFSLIVDILLLLVWVYVLTRVRKSNNLDYLKMIASIGCLMGIIHYMQRIF